MEFALLFFMAGLFIFAVKHGVQEKSRSIQFMAFLVTGIVSGIIISFAAKPPWPDDMSIPRQAIPILAGLAGILLFIVERYKLISRPGILYFITIILGLIHACISYMLFIVYKFITSGSFQTPANGTGFFIVLLLIGFVTMFGYTFPERWFRQQKPKKESE
jgi:hypothetical protein